jgi:glutathione synthase/RimK-type ligase-like ATP-grasp enzyme
LAEIRRRVGFVTFAGAATLTEDDRLALEPLARRGVDVQPLVWDDPAVEWSRYAGLVLRSTWDYHRKGPAFLAWLDRLAAAGCRLWNPVRLVRWNMDKTYLRDLSARGIPISPTEWLAAGRPAGLAGILDRTGWPAAVVKPTLSATAFLTWTASPESAAADQKKLDDMLRRGSVLVQRFEEAITAGEWSLVYFAGRFSHSVIKRPAAGDFRVQKEYGGTSHPAEAPERVRLVADRVLGAVELPWLYARVDLVDSESGVRLMELEMLEPDLFLRHDPGAAERFARAICDSI